MPVENSSSNLIILYGGFLTSAKILIVLYPGDKLLAPVMYLRKKPGLAKFGIIFLTNKAQNIRRCAPIPCLI